MAALRIRTKLLLAIVSINTILALAMYLLNSISFERGFSGYLGQQILERQTTLVNQLQQTYQTSGSWLQLRQHPEFFQQLVRYYAVSGRNAERATPPQQYDNATPPNDLPPPPPFAGHHPPHRPPEDWFGWVLLDADKQTLAGPAATLPPETVVRPLIVDNKTVGFLGYLPRRELAKTLNNAFKAQQQQTFALIALAMLIASALLAWGIAEWLNRRLLGLTHGTQALTAGDFQHVIAIDSDDELAQLARDFNTLAHTLDNNQRSRQRWIVDISHELRTPLAILQGELEALRDGVRPVSATNIQSLWHEIRRISCLVDDLHLLSQADAGSLSYNWQLIDLDKLIANVLSQFSHQFANHELHVSFQPQHALITGDAARLTQLWVNLAQNTLRYTDAQGQLHIKMTIIQQRVVVTWQDSSPGVNDADLPRLTERLFRVDSSRNRNSGGSGLGLSIVQAIAQAHQASLQPSRSELGGLCWTLSFALADGD